MIIIRKCHMMYAHKNRSLSYCIRQEVCLLEMTSVGSQHVTLSLTNGMYCTINSINEQIYPSAIHVHSMRYEFSNHELTSLGWNPEYMYNLYSAPITYENQLTMEAVTSLVKIFTTSGYCGYSGKKLCSSRENSKKKN